MNNIKPDANAVTESDMKREISQPLIAVIDVCETDKRRNQARAKQRQQNGEPPIRPRFPLPSAPGEQRGENRPLQQADENDDASEIKKIDFHKPLNCKSTSENY